MRAKTGPGLWSLAFASATALFLLFQLGYSFETGDQQQYLLLPYRSIYPQFLPGDWFTWQTSHYHQTYSWLVRGLHALSGEAAFPNAMLCAQLIVLLSLGYAILELAQSLGYGVAEAACAVLVLGVVRAKGMAGATLNHAQLIPADLALPPFLLACAAWARGRALWTGVWLGVAGFWHANFAVLGPLVLGPLELERCLRTRKVAPLLQMTGAFLVLAAPTLMLLVDSFLAHDSAPAAVAITLFVRSPHHYELRAMQAVDYSWPLLLCALSVPTLLLGQKEGVAGGDETADHRGVRLRLLAALCAIVTLGLLGSALRILPLVRIFVWRMSVPLIVVLLLTAAHAVRALRERRESLTWLWALSGSCAVLAFTRADLQQVAAWGTTGAAFALPVILPLLMAAVLLCRGPTWRTPLVAALCAIAVAWSVPVLRLPPGKFWDGERTLSAHGPRLFGAPITVAPAAFPLFTLVAQRTPKDARFLAPPGMVEFRLATRRSVFVDWKCAPMKGDEALEWKRRMLAVMGTSDFPAVGYLLRHASDVLYLKRPMAELVELARREGMTHVIASRRSLKEHVTGAHVVFSYLGYTVYALDAQPSAYARLRYTDHAQVRLSQRPLTSRTKPSGTSSARLQLRVNTHS